MILKMHHPVMWFFYTTLIISVSLSDGLDKKRTEPFVEIPVAGNSTIIFNKQKSALTLIEKKYLSVLCDYDEERSQMLCTISAKPTYSNEYVPSCEFITSSAEGRKFKKTDSASNITAYSLESLTRAVLIWTEIQTIGRVTSEFTHLQFFHMPTSSKESKLEFRHEQGWRTPTHVIVNENTVDVVSSDPEKCNPWVSCIISYNSTGHQLREPRDFPVESSIDDNLEPAVVNSTSQGFYLISSRLASIKYINAGNLAIPLETPFSGIGSFLYSAISVSHGALTICGVFPNNSAAYSVDSDYVYCNYFNGSKSSAPIRDKKDIALVSKESRIIAVHNLPHGGFLLFELQCKSYPEYVCEGRKIHTVQKDGQTKTHGIYGGEIPECTGNAYSSIYISSIEQGDKICFYVSCVFENRIKSMERSRLVRYYHFCVSKNLIA